MSRFRFVHASDLHLDTPFEGIGRVPPAVAEVLRDASVDAWDALVKLTIDRDACCLLLAGDVCEGAERGIRAQRRLLDGVQRLSEHGIPVLLVKGSCDPMDGWPAIREWPPGVTVFPGGDVASVAVMRAGARLATVHGASSGRGGSAENLVAGFRRGEEAGLHIGLLHCNVGQQLAYDTPKACSAGDLRAGRMDYWALGYVHRRLYVASGDPWIVYPGTLQGRAPTVPECGPKGAVVVEVEGGAVRQVSFEALDRARCARFDLDVSNCADAAGVTRALLRRAEHLRDENGGRGLLLHASLVGEGAAARDLQRSGCPALLEELRRQSEGWSPFVWWAGLADQTRAGAVGGAKEPPDLAGLVRRWGVDLARDADRLGRFLDQRFEPLLRKWAAELEPDEACDLLRRGSELAQALLNDEEHR
jgi:exonuclease SbcD